MGIRLFAEDDVWKIVAMHADGVSVTQIAEAFDCRRETIREIVTGQTYRDITCANHRPGSKRCPCLRCGITARAERNIQKIEEISGPWTEIVVVACMFCGNKAATTVRNGRAHHGEVACFRHGGRKP